MNTKLTYTLQVILFILAGAGFFSSLWAVPELFLYHDANTWPEKPAQVITSRMQESTRAHGYCARPEIIFRYRHNGAYKTAFRYGFRLLGCGFPALAEKDLQRFPVGPAIAHVDSTTGRALLSTELYALYFWPVTTLLAALGFILVTRRWNRINRAGPD